MPSLLLHTCLLKNYEILKHTTYTYTQTKVETFAELVEHMFALSLHREIAAGSVGFLHETFSVALHEPLLCQWPFSLGC